MDDVKEQAAPNPDATADQATPDALNEAPTANAEGTSAAAVDTTSTDASAEAISTPPTAETATTSSSDAVSADTISGDTSAEITSADATDADTATQSATPTQNDAASVDSDSIDSDSVDSDSTMTMEDVMAASDEKLSRPPVHRGMTVTGSIIMMGQDGIVVDVGAKIEGTLPYNQLFEFETSPEEAKKYFKAGDEITVYIVRSDIPNNQIILSKKRADAERAWNLLQEIYDKKLPVEVEVVEKVRGGLVANLGVRAFLPASQVDVRRISDLTPYVGERLKVKIIELNRKRNRVIVSRRAVLEEELVGVKEETLKKLEPGAQLEGEVVEITDFGVFVNLGGIDGLVHRSELTHGRFNHPKDVVELGQKVKVEVLDMDLERERINLSMKKLAGNPWEDVLLNYSIGQKIEGKVTNLTQFGAFVEIESGLEGLIHVSEMSWTKRIRHPKEVLSEGEDVEAMILKIDADSQRISLGLRQTQPDPWSSLPDRYPPGTEVTGPITGITEFGVFMEIEEGIEGLVHISELAHEHIEDINEHFNKDDEISAVILNIDPVEQRASLSRKRLLPFTSEMASDSVPMGAPASRGGGRKGRRGGRRSQGIDYDYSYAATETGAKTTTKLGDVYADLFAQFGLSDTSDEGDSGDTSAEAKSDSAKSDEANTADTADTAPRATTEATATSAGVSEDSAATDPEVEAAAETLEENLDTSATAEPEEEVDPENAIDAAEAAALLTAAFREGKRPAAETDSAAATSDSATEASGTATSSTSTDDDATSANADSSEATADTSDVTASDATTSDTSASEAVSSDTNSIDYDKYVADVKKYAADADETRIHKIVDSMKGILNNRDAMLVACSQKDELEHVREKFLKSKLGCSESDEELDTAIQDVCSMMSDTRNKSRVTFYYLLTDKLGAQDYWS